MTILDDDKEQSSEQKQSKEDTRSMPPPPVPHSISATQIDAAPVMRQQRCAAVSPQPTEAKQEYTGSIESRRKRKAKEGKMRAVSSSALEQQASTAAAVFDDPLNLVHPSRRRAIDSDAGNQAEAAQESLGPTKPGSKRKRKSEIPELNANMVPLTFSRLQTGATDTERLGGLKKVAVTSKVSAVTKDEMVIDLTQGESGPESEAETDHDDSVEYTHDPEFIRLPGNEDDRAGVRLPDQNVNPPAGLPSRPPPSGPEAMHGLPLRPPPRPHRSRRRFDDIPVEQRESLTQIQLFVQGQYDAYNTREDRVGGEANPVKL